MVLSKSICLLAALNRGGKNRAGRSLFGSLVLAALLAAVPAAKAALAVAASLPGLDVAMQERVAEILANPDKTATEHQEAKALQRAINTFGQYGGSLESYTGLVQQGEIDNGQLDMKTLVRVAELVELSDTRDDDILLHMVALRDALDGFGVEARQGALATEPLIVAESSQQQVLDLVTLGDNLRTRGLTEWADSFGEGATDLVDAWSFFHEAADFASMQQLMEAVENPVDLEPLGVEPGLSTPYDPEVFSPFEVNAMVSLDNPAPELTIAVNLISADRMAFAESGTMPLPVQVTLAEETLIDVPAGTLTCPITSVIPAFVGEAVLQIEDSTEEADRFGLACDIGAAPTPMDPLGETAVVSSIGPEGEVVVVLRRNQGGPDAWGESARIVSPFEAAAEFGASLAISGDTLVVGAPNAITEAGEPPDGLVMVYERTAPGTWVPAALLEGFASPSLIVGAEFGAAVDIFDDRIVVGAPLHLNQAGGFGLVNGSAYLFDRKEGGPGAWGQVAELRQLLPVPVPVYWWGFGSSVAIDGDLVVVGSPGQPDYGPYSRGTAQVFGSDGLTWSYVTYIQDDSADSGFGASVSVDESAAMIVVGAPAYDTPTQQDAGMVVVYDGESIGGWEFTETKRLTAPSPTAGDRFGSGVGLFGELLVVGSPGHDHSGWANPGSVYVFASDHVPGCDPPADPMPGDWGLFVRRTSAEPGPLAGFGSSVAAYGDTFLVTEPEDHGELPGTAHAFTGMEPILQGDYYLAIAVDPHDRIIEEMGTEDPESNLLADESQLVTICVPPLDEVNLSLDALEASPDFIIAEVTGGQTIQRTRAGLDATVSMTGSFDGPLSGATLETEIVFVSAPAGVSFPSDPIQGTIFDPSLGPIDPETMQPVGAYAAAFPLPDMVTGDTVSVHVDLEYDIAMALSPEDYEVKLVLTVVSPVPETAPGPGMDDNEMEVSGQHYTVVQYADCSFYETYEKSMGNSDFNVSLSMGGVLDLAADFDSLTGNPTGQYPEALGEQGAIGSLSAVANLTLMGNDLGEFVRWRNLIERDPIQHYGFVGSELRLTNPITGHVDIIYAVGPYDTETIPMQDFWLLPPWSSPTISYEPPKDPPGEHAPEPFAMGTYDPDTGSISLTVDQFSLDKEFDKEKTFFPGGYPVTVKGAAMGKIGVDLTFTVGDALVFDIEPFVQLNADASLEIGECSVLCVGATGELKPLVDERFIVTSALGLAVYEDVIPGGPGQAIGASACFRVTNRLTLLDGQIDAFAKYPWFSWCQGAFGIWYPCDFRIKTSTLPIVDWDGFTFVQELVNVSSPSCCVQLHPDLGFADCTGDGPCTTPDP